MTTNLSTEPANNVRPSQCKGCGGAIFWLKHESSGNSTPIDARSSPEGNLRLDRERGTYTALNRDMAQIARCKGERLHLNHFVTCPKADRFKKAKGATR